MADTTTPNSPDNIATMSIPRDQPKGDGNKPPAKLSYDAAVAKWQARGYPKPSAMGMADNLMRESGGDPTAIGDHGTSRGLFQEHDSRKDELEAYAKKQGKSPDNPDVQFDFADQEIKTKFPTLYKQLMAGTDRSGAEDSFKRIFERPASIMWDKSPSLASDKYRFSDYAMKEHDGRKNTDVVFMSPADYLDLSPELDGKPFSNASGRALKASVGRGEPVESVPTLDMQVDGNTGTVTDQDGRHRALLAQQEGVDAIPVAIRQKGQGTPTEIQGMSGAILPNDFRKAADVPKAAPRPAANAANPAPNQDPISLQGQDQPATGQPAQPDQRSLLGRIGDAIIPRAEAAEPSTGSTTLGAPVDYDPFAGSAGGGQQSAASQSTTLGAPVDHDPFAQPDGMVMSAVKGAGAGLGKTVLAGQELVGKGLEAVGATAPGEWLVNDARKGIANLGQEIAPDQAAHPIATGIGDIAGGMVLPGGIAGKIGGNALRAAAIGGGVAGLLTPSAGDGGDYWKDKALQTGAGAAGGAVTGKVGNALAGMVAPRLRATVGTLMGEGVELTPGQMAGGAMKRAEDAMASIPILGSAIRAAQRRSIQTFNRAAINRSLADINASLPQGTESGHDAISYAEQQFRDAYNQVIPSMRGIRDPVFMQNLNNIITRAHAQGTPTELPQEYIDRLNFAIQNEIIDRFDANGHISGDLAQNVGTRLDELIGPMIRSDNPYTQKIGYALRQADRALDDMMSAHNPMLQAAKDRIDSGWAKFKTVQRAAAAAGAHPDGTFTPAQLSRSVLARDRSKDKAAFARGDAMMQDLASAARDVLPQTVPDSGTPERAALMGILGGAAKFEPHTAAALGLSALPYVSPVSRTTNAVVNRLAQTPGPARNALAEILRRSGALAAPAAGSLAAGSIPTMSIPRTIQSGSGQ